MAQKTSSRGASGKKTPGKKRRAQKTSSQGAARKRRSSRKAQEIVGVSDHIEQLRSRIREVAKKDATVLIEGPTGTGKELVARMLHSLSNRREKPFIPVNCGGITDSLFESELFGHERGAFTGAVKKSLGRIGAAKGGTLFLDEVGSMPQSQQPKLLRFLEYGTYFPVGSHQEERADVRIIAATNKDLLEESENGSFQKDLYYRLDQLEIETKPLRNYPEDIVCLTCHFDGKRKTDPRVKFLLYSYQFPGNVRQLKNMLVDSFDGVKKKLCKATRASNLTESIRDTINTLEELEGNSKRKRLPKEAYQVLLQHYIEPDPTRDLRDPPPVDIQRLLEVYEIFVLRYYTHLSNQKIASTLHIRPEFLTERGFKERYRFDMPDKANITSSLRCYFPQDEKKRAHVHIDPETEVIRPVRIGSEFLPWLGTRIVGTLAK